MSEGSLVLLRISNKYTGSHFKLINTAYLLNKDCSSKYYFSDVKKNTLNNGWSSVTTEYFSQSE